VGKSFAYLLPAIERARATGERVVIATNTIALQEQLLGKDVPLIRRALGLSEEDLKIVLVKGRGNYLSIRRLQLASKKQDRLFPDEASRRTLHQIEDWAYETDDGTLASLPQLERPAVWDRVQSDSGNCMGRRCPTYKQCFYQRARREMERGQVLITNHALFFSDLALRSRDVGFLPKYDHVILDEAHAVEDVACEHFGVSLAEGRVRHLLSLLLQERTGRGFLATLPMTGDDAPAIERARDGVRNATAAADHFFDRLARIVEQGPARGSAPGSTTGSPAVRIREAGVVENTLTPAFKDLSLALKRLRERMTRDEDRYELNAYVDRAALVALEAELLVDQEVEGCAYWVEMTSGGRGRRVTVACSPIEVAPILEDKLFGGEHSTILTSATLTTHGGSFAHAARRLGAEGAETLALGSPFDHAEQAELIVEADMPDPRSPAYVDRLAERTRSHASGSGGGAFVLFTSVRTMNAVADRLESSLREAGLPMFVQGRDASRERLLERFRRCENGVLLGVASFWQGVDVQGDALRLVIITRLPFEPPDRPITEARSERLRERGEDPFRSDQLPRAIIRFRQGFGRLIRSASDRGRVVVLDPRIVSKGYGRQFLRSLPEGVRASVVDSMGDEAPLAIEPAR